MNGEEFKHNIPKSKMEILHQREINKVRSQPMAQVVFVSTEAAAQEILDRYPTCVRVDVSTLAELSREQWKEMERITKVGRHSNEFLCVYLHDNIPQRNGLGLIPRSIRYHAWFHPVYLAELEAYYCVPAHERY